MVAKGRTNECFLLRRLINVSGADGKKQRVLGWFCGMTITVTSKPKLDFYLDFKLKSY